MTSSLICSLRGYLTKYDCSSGQYFIFLPVGSREVIGNRGCRSRGLCSGCEPYRWYQQDRSETLHRVGTGEVPASDSLAVKRSLFAPGYV